MNEIVLQRTEMPATRENRPRPPSVVLRRHLDAHGERQRLIKIVSKFVKAAADLRTFRGHSLSGGYADEYRDADQKLPSSEKLNRMLSDVERRPAATAREIATITGAMIDAIPTFDASRSPGYLDALLLTLEQEASIEPISAEDLAVAAFRILRSERFAPTPDKVLKQSVPSRRPRKPSSPLREWQSSDARSFRRDRRLALRRSRSARPHSCARSTHWRHQR